MLIRGQSDIEIQISDVGYICLRQHDAEGTHEIEFSKEGYYPAQATIKVPANARVPVELELMARREAK